MNIIVIPARLESTRLPNKLLSEVEGEPLIGYTVRNALESKKTDRVLVVTDDEIIDKYVKYKYDVETINTGPANSGTHRISKIPRIISKYDRICNLQGDEPFIRGEIIDKALSSSESLDDRTILTLGTKLSKINYLNPNCVKVVINNDRMAMYFSRAPIPFGSHDAAIRHIGLYVYPRAFFNSVPESTKYKGEKLEQLAWIEANWKIYVRMCDELYDTIGIDTAEELEIFKEMVRNGLVP